MWGLLVSPAGQQEGATSAFSGFLTLFDDKASTAQNDRPNERLIKMFSAME